jgi:N-acyl-D-aspartate/D-glutamate deacylase
MGRSMRGCDVRCWSRVGITGGNSGAWENSLREQKLMSLSEAIRKITSAPAQRFGLSGRGRIANGYNTDVTVFDPERTDSDASYDSPETPPKGLHLILREGKTLFRATSSGNLSAGVD